MKKKKVLIHYEGRSKTRTKTGNAPSTINFAVHTLIPLIFYFKSTSLKKYGTGLNLQALEKSKVL